MEIQVLQNGMAITTVKAGTPITLRSTGVKGLGPSHTTAYFRVMGADGKQVIGRFVPLSNGIGSVNIPEGIPEPTEYKLPMDYRFLPATDDTDGLYFTVTPGTVTPPVVTPPAGTLSITTTKLEDWARGIFKMQTLASSGGIAPLNWQARGLPTALSMSTAKGAISGVATARGTFSVEITLKDAARATAHVVLPLNVT